MALLACLGLAGPAGAVAPSELPGYSSLGPTIVAGDGSIFGAGETGEPFWDGNVPNPGATRSPLVVKLRPDGSVDPAFAEGGIARFTDLAGEQPLEIMPSGDGGVLLATSKHLLKLRPDGTPDHAFGTGGRIGPLAYGGLDVAAAAVQGDGKIVVATGDYHQGIYVARFTAAGEPDPGFGTGGIAHFDGPEPPTLSYAADLGIDGDGRILVGGLGTQDPVAMRLLPDGQLDLGFGPDGDGYSGPVTPLPGFDRVAGHIVVDADGDFRLYGTAALAMYQYVNFGYSYSADGTVQGEPTTYPDGGSNVVAETPGGLATSAAPGRGVAPSFKVLKWNATGEPAPGFASYEPRITPGTTGTRGITFSPGDGTLIATGYAEGLDCGTECSTKTFMAAAKLDAQTGAPVPGFGVDGVALIPGNECAHGRDRSVVASPWNRCRVKPPAISAKFKFRHGKSRRPALTGTVRLGDIQARPPLMERRVMIRLPYKAKLRAGTKSKIAVKVHGTGVASWTTKITNRQRIWVDIRPDDSEYDWFSGPDLPNGPARVKVKLRRGALTRIKPKVRRQALRFRTVGILTPTEQWTGPGGPAIDWYAPKRSFKVTKIRPVKVVRPASG